MYICISQYNVQIEWNLYGMDNTIIWADNNLYMIQKIEIPWLNALDSWTSLGVLSSQQIGTMECQKTKLARSTMRSRQKYENADLKSSVWDQHL